MTGLPLTKDDIEDFDNVDEKNKFWRELGLRQRGAESLRTDRPDMYFPIYVNPNDLSISLQKSETHEIEVYPKKSDGREGRWMWGKQKVIKESRNTYARLIKRRNEYDIFIKDYLERNDEIRTKKPKSIWVDKEVNTEAGGKLLKQIFPNSGFSYPKPIGLLNLLIRIAGIQNEIILDFFAGSATAAPFLVAFGGFLVMLGAALWFEHRLRRLGRAGMDQLTDSLRIRGVRDYFGLTGERRPTGSDAGTDD